MNSNLLPSFIRTAVPILVTLIAGWFARQGIDIDSVELTAIISAAAGWLYYAIVRLLEVKFPQFGWLLGYAVRPAYVARASGEKVVLADTVKTEAETPAPAPAHVYTPAHDGHFDHPHEDHHRSE